MSDKESVFTQHLKDCEENYFEHLLFSTTISIWLLWAAITLFLHGLFPFLFIEKPTRHVRKINQVLQIRISRAKKRHNKRQSQQ